VRDCAVWDGVTKVRWSSSPTFDHSFKPFSCDESILDANGASCDYFKKIPCFYARNRAEIIGLIRESFWNCSEISCPHRRKYFAARGERERSRAFWHL